MGCVCSKDRELTTSPREKASLPRRLSSNFAADSKETLTSKLSQSTSKVLRPNGHAATQAEDVIERRKEKLLHSQSEQLPSSLPSVAPNPLRTMAPKALEGEHVAVGWPTWLASVAGEAIKGWIPRRADSFEKLDKIGQGTYSNVYKARDLQTGNLVALKKVRFDNLEPESVRFMAREIEVLRRLDHPNIVKLEGLVTSRQSCSLYLVFEYMEHDLAGLAASPGVIFTEPQVKCYMQQLLRGLEHCHSRGVLHRDIKGSNLLLDNNGTLKIADFGLATFYRPEENVPLTSRVVTLWYRPPELLLGATNYGVAVDLWSSGCILAELLAGKPIMPGRTEVEQLHKIFKLCGSPSEEYWRRSRLPHATIFKPTQPYKRSLLDTFKDFPASSLQLVDKLLSIEPLDRGTAAAALTSAFFTQPPLPCEPSSLPQYPPSKEYDAKLRDEEARRQRAAGGARAGRGPEVAAKRASVVHRPSRAVPAPHANAELIESVALQKLQMARQGQGAGAAQKSMSEKFSINEPQGGSFAPPNMQVAAPPAALLPSSLETGGPRDTTSPVPPLPTRPVPTRVSHSSKSGPQPSLPKPTGLNSFANWGASKVSAGPTELPDVRMAPPRAQASRPGKSITVPDFALQGGYPDNPAKGLDSASSSRLRGHADGSSSSSSVLGGGSSSRGGQGQPQHQQPQQPQPYLSAKKVRGVEMSERDSHHRRERSISEPGQVPGSGLRHDHKGVAAAPDMGIGMGMGTGSMLMRNSATSAADDRDGMLDSSSSLLASVPKPVPWRQQSHSGPLQMPTRKQQQQLGGGGGGGGLGLYDKRPYDNSSKGWMGTASGMNSLTIGGGVGGALYATQNGVRDREDDFMMPPKGPHHLHAVSSSSSGSAAAAASASSSSSSALEPKANGLSSSAAGGAPVKAKFLPRISDGFMERPVVVHANGE